MPEPGTPGAGPPPSTSVRTLLERLAGSACGVAGTPWAVLALWGDRAEMTAPSPAFATRISAEPVTGEAMRLLADLLRRYDGTLVIQSADENSALRSVDARACAAVPVRCGAGNVRGAVCALSPEPREWGAEELAALRGVASAAEAVLTLDEEPRAAGLPGEMRAVQLIEETGRGFFYARGLDDRFTAVSGSVRDVLGYEPAELVGLTPHSLHDGPSLHPPGGLSAGARREPYMQAVRDRFGERRVLRIVEGPLREGGELVGAHGLAWDVTDLVRATEALRESDNLLRQITENIHEVFWITDVETGTVEYVSPAYEEVWGLSADELYADRGALLAAVHPGDREAVAAAQATMAQDGYDLEYRVVRASDGAVRWVHARAFPAAGEGGRVTRMVGVAEDVTERKEWQLALQSRVGTYALVGRAVHEVLTDWDLESDRVAWDGAVRPMLGYAPEEMGSTLEWWVRRIHPDDLERVIGGIDGVTNGLTATYVGEFRFQRRDGSHVPVLGRFHADRDAGGSPARVVGSMLDMSGHRGTDEGAGAGRPPSVVELVRPLPGVGGLPGDLLTLSTDRPGKVGLYRELSLEDLPPAVAGELERLSPRGRQPHGGPGAGGRLSLRARAAHLRLVP
ncbi:MAG TPA: PAS domain-containing protein [Longimicrobiaceae bacterium]|nr:PAS domain-containing protein [Longimicrobiaceae bacterium]